ncbi:hypothetical protein SISNIDRAFT_202360 [Sistotremastrum niveocremeum HHB9708]|uniref:Uncharacterized protein n=2 Tax=Sistotremastraceae TaxID=3402574 RepID=A0A164ZR49_9AGAM|nr:hypothetical protein SISNIDRAFT_202360 [Sistotremastrum niveocremeum HHB9708]KZT36816.1 hypothetical protein SISSUDRAFT_920365 [Sistotremastrum suecicum HHB10207 ss-3]
MSVRTHHTIHSHGRGSRRSVDRVENHSHHGNNNKTYYYSPPPPQTAASPPSPPRYGRTTYISAPPRSSYSQSSSSGHGHGSRRSSEGSHGRSSSEYRMTNPGTRRASESSYARPTVHAAAQPVYREAPATIRSNANERYRHPAEKTVRYRATDHRGNQVPVMGPKTDYRDEHVSMGERWRRLLGMGPKPQHSSSTRQRTVSQPSVRQRHVYVV